MPTYNSKQFGTAADQFIGEASMLKIPPGKYPEQVVIKCDDKLLTFHYSHDDRHNGGVIGWRYKEIDGRHCLLIIND